MATPAENTGGSELVIGLDRRLEAATPISDGSPEQRLGREIFDEFMVIAQEEAEIRTAHLGIRKRMLSLMSESREMMMICNEPDELLGQALAQKMDELEDRGYSEAFWEAVAKHTNFLIQSSRDQIGQKFLRLTEAIDAQ